ncbi:serine/threonine protein kinase [Actinoplanes couchii]|uniref:Protein kinase domain-containing protein n=1 Tax=Actinoplanes couchii TaxID=403638 RepID=A0ABQ3XE71_9ACTN|nr:serine/threonine protein kinase [Actinoplanes couchii]MDR6317303.1 serine/threonine protein kinase [Actinoplanes couchii]GID56797.1 hypothetical protein Aco03nite_052010 [Actinoplanes couchii]
MSDPERIGDYQVVGKLGAGGMGVVYLARKGTDRPVAVKVVHAGVAGDPEFRRRFREEVAAARQVPPFCTAELLDADPDAPEPYLVVEYVDGPTLGEEVRTKGPLNAANLHSLAIGVATALTAIHGAGVIHRDLKPGNVLLAPGSPKVIDFGIARAMEATENRLTRTGVYMGTVNYMAPERFDEPASPLTPAADVFAWGCVLAFAGTGRPPFDAGTPMATMARIVAGKPSLDGFPQGPLRELVERALSTDPAARPNARELLDLLLGGKPSPLPAPAPAPLPLPGKAEAPATKKGRKVAVLASAVLVLVTLLGGAGLLARRNSAQAVSPVVPEPGAPQSSGVAAAPPVQAPAKPSVPGPASEKPAVKTPKSQSPAPSPAGSKTAKAAAAPDNLPPARGAGKEVYGPYFIVNLATGFCVDIDGVGAGAPEQPVLQDLCKKVDEDNQEFTFVRRGADKAGNQLYWIRNSDDGLCLDVPGTGAVDLTTPVTENSCLEGDNQEYRIQYRLGSGGRKYFWIINSATEYCLDVYGEADGGPATHLTLVNCVTGDDHEWALVRKADW